MVREFREVLEKGYTGSDGVRRSPDWGKTIVFAVTKRHAETLAWMLDEALADKKPHPTTRYADFVVSGMEAQDTLDAPAVIRRFKKEEFPQILVSVNMLDTGFDCPEVVNLVMARFTKSGVLYQQMRGRGTRMADHIKKASSRFSTSSAIADFDDDEDPLPGGPIIVKPGETSPASRVACSPSTCTTRSTRRHASGSSTRRMALSLPRRRTRSGPTSWACFTRRSSAAWS